MFFGRGGGGFKTRLRSSSPNCENPKDIYYFLYYKKRPTHVNVSKNFSVRQRFIGNEWRELQMSCRKYVWTETFYFRKLSSSGKEKKKTTTTIDFQIVNSKYYYRRHSECEYNPCSCSSFADFVFFFRF